MASWLRAALGDAQLRIIDIHMKFSEKRTKSATVTYDHRLNKTSKPLPKMLDEQSLPHLWVY